jgi:hypothetical protein
VKWFKHDADAASDAKVKKLLLRHGAVGYAIYFHCLELIAADIADTNITFELEHDAEIIADNLKIRGTAEKSGIDTVNEIMRYMVALGLFECSDNRITCFKMLKRLDSSMTSSPKMRQMITSARDNHDSVMTGSCKTRLEETRLDKKRVEKRVTHKPKIIQHQTLDVPIGETRYGNLCTDYGREYVDRRIEAAILWAEEKGVVVKDYAARVGKWILSEGVEKKRPHKVCPDCSKEYIGTLCVYCGYEEGKA